MKPTNHWFVRTLLVLGLMGAGSAFGQITVTLTPRDSLGEVIRAPIEPGTRVRVEIALAIDTELLDAAPIEQLRIFQFDFVATSESLELGTFRWLVNFGTYSMRSDVLPRPSAESTDTTGSADLITLTETELTVASIEVIVNGRGTLNVVGSSSDLDSIGAQFEAGFNPVRRFTLFGGDISGGTLQFVVTGSDRDGDGIPDTTDDFPDDPDESIDTDDDGTGNNADTDDDGDGVTDVQDAFPLDPTEDRDTDGDDVGDNADPFPDDPTESMDTDDDGMGNNADLDDDDDGAADTVDAFPLDPTEQNDSNNNGIGDNAEQNSNTGPRATGGLCGPGVASASLGMMLAFAAARRRSARSGAPTVDLKRLN